MDVLYCKKSLLRTSLRTNYDATYSDRADENTGLAKCLRNLRSGDTLYVERESFLADSVAGALSVLRNLAQRGVNVYLERNQKLIRSEESPFRSLSDDLAHSLIGFRKAFTKLRQREGYQKARAEGRRISATKRPLPENFEAVKQRWLAKEIPITEAAAECEMAVSTFWTRCKEN